MAWEKAQSESVGRVLILKGSCFQISAANQLAVYARELSMQLSILRKVSYAYFLEKYPPFSHETCVLSRRSGATIPIIRSSRTGGEHGTYCCTWFKLWSLVFRVHM